MTIDSANRLAALRRAHNLSQEELAERLNVSRQAVSKWERAESSPDTDNLVALARLYGVSLDSLLGLEESAPLEYEAPMEDQEPIEPVTHADAFEEEPVSIPNGDVSDALPNGSYYEHIAQQAAQAAEAAEAEVARERHRRRMSFPYPVFVTIAYLVLGFLFHMWHPGWIIFLTIPLFYLPDSEREPLRLLGNPVMITIIYLLLGCLCNAWHPGWLVFLLIPVLNSISRR